MTSSNSPNERRIAANVERIVARQPGKVLSSMPVISRFLTEAEREELANRDAVRPMDRLAHPIRCRNGRAS